METSEGDALLQLPPCDGSLSLLRSSRRRFNSRFCPDNSFVSFRRVRDDDVDTNRICLRCNRNERLGLGRNKVRARGIFRVDR